MSQPIAIQIGAQQTYLVLGAEMRVLSNSERTEGQFSLVEMIIHPGGDSGLHVQHRADQSMYLVEGELEVTIADRIFTITKDETSQFHRGVPQRVRNTSQEPARSIVLTTPGGFEHFIARVGIPIVAGIVGRTTQPSENQLDNLHSLAEEYWIEIISPPEFPSNRISQPFWNNQTRKR